MNRPDSGPRFDQNLPRGDHRFQLYSLGTPNGQKVTILFEELLEKGFSNAEYDAYYIDIGKGDQFGSDFVSMNPNSKIPVLYDSKQENSIFESGHILLYLAEEFDQFLPMKERTPVLNWLFWLQGSAPYLGGGFGHFYHYAPEKIKYAIDRFTMETKRHLHLLDSELKTKEFIAGDEISIADFAIFPWYGNLMINNLYEASRFLQVESYTHLMRWSEQLQARPAVSRGMRVNKSWGENPVKERHSSADFS